MMGDKDEDVCNDPIKTLRIITLCGNIKQLLECNTMTTTIRISDNIIHDARIFGKIYNRSVPKQIEFWSKLGKIAEENPEMTYDEIRALLFALEEKKVGDVDEFKFSS